jgi:hypothetical protein
MFLLPDVLDCTLIVLQGCDRTLRPLELKKNEDLSTTTAVDPELVLAGLGIFKPQRDYGFISPCLHEHLTRPNFVVHAE